jgi:ATP-dependent helicase/nuclease subunit A
LVGDRKQSIYGWRSADLAAYEAFVDDLKAAGGVEGRLSKNYRSVPEILAEVERAIDPVMRREPQVQPEFQPLLPVREAPHAPLPERCAAIEYWIPALPPGASGAGAKTRRRDAVEIEAAALAHDLRALHAGGGVAWKDVAVLFRARGDFETYLEALRAAGIPYAVEGDRSYFRRREIIDAAALVRCVAEPNDHLALLTVLRSALGGVPDAALLPLWAHDLAGRVARLEDDAGDELSKLRELAAGVARELPRDVPGIGRIAGWEQNAAALWAAIARLRRSLREDPPDVFVERLRTLTLLDATEAGRFLGRLRTANLERFWRELAAALAGEGGVHALLRLLRRAVASERERAESRPAEAAEDAVRVMTIHAAKGLDFRHVYLMQLDKEPPPQANERAISGRVRPGAPLEFRLLGAPTPGFDRVARERERVAEAERVRALYVAMTRAKDRLVLSGLWPDAGSKRKRSFTALLAERRDPAGDPAARMQALAAEGASDRADAGCVRWVFPSLAAAAEAEVVPPPAADAVWPPLERIEADSLRLASAREAARAREARPFAGTASAAAEETLADVAERRYGERGGALAPRDEGASAACEDGATPSSGGAPPAGGVARAVGTAIHRALEELDLAADPEAELARASEALAESVRSLAAPGAQDEAIAAARELLARIGRGALFARLRALGAGELHRELPVLLPPEAERGAVGFVAGVIDLVYRDPGTGRLVVADYKTDRAANDAQIVEHARHYAPQGAVYQRALREALALDYTPRFELWLLDADRVAVVSE